MEEIEVPLEKAQEDIHEMAEHAKSSWISKVALFSALIAVAAAISALMAGHHSNEAMISQIKASDTWSRYQAKSVRASILNSKMDLLKEMGKNIKDEDAQKVAQYKEDQEKISEEAKELEAESAHHLLTHEILAKSVTMFQVAIAIAAISVLTRRRRFWFVSMVFGLVGLGFFVQGLLS